MKTRTGLSCVCILLNSIIAGSLATFPLFGPSMKRSLALSMTQTSSIAVGATLGQYGTGFVFGALNDAKGPQFVSLCAAVLLTAGYGLMASALARNADNWVLLGWYYSLAGAGTSASYFANLSTSVKTFPSHSGLAIGIPTSIFGLAPLLMSYVGSALFTDNDGELDAFQFLAFLGGLALVVHLFSACFLREPDVLAFSDDADKPVEATDNDENSPLLPQAAQEPAPVSPFAAFFKDQDALILAFVFMLSAGPSEAIQASLGNVVEALLSVTTQDGGVRRPAPSHSALKARSRQVQAFALCNTLARIGLGGLSDVLCPVPGSSGRQRISRLGLYAGAAALFTASLIWSSFRLTSIDQLYGLSIPAGLMAGTVFSLTPSIIARRWPLSHFGLYWGLVVLACSVGTCVFTALYGWLSDRQAGTSLVCHGPRCFRATFGIMAWSVGVVGVVCLLLSRKRPWLGVV